MTLQEIRDIIVLRYKVEALKRKQETIDLNKNEKFFASLIAEGQQEVQRITAVLRSYYEITTVAGQREYTLPHLFGRETMVFDPAYGKLEPQSITDIEAVDTTHNARPVEFAVRDGNPSKIILNPTPDGVYTVKVHYVVSPKFYSPSASTPEWGSFDGYNYTGELLLPDEYLIAVWQYVIAQLVDDYYPVYRKTLHSLRQSKRFPPKPPKYRMGGYSARTPSFVQQSSSSTTTGRRFIAPTDKMADWGGLIIDVKECIPYIPIFEIVKVPSWIS